jgi:hypothetical protein
MFGGKTSSSLLRRREEVNLSLRKNKIFEQIMQKRLKSFNAAKFVINELEIDIKKLGIPQAIIKNFSASKFRKSFTQRCFLRGASLL